MNLEKELEGHGYTAAVAELEEFRRIRDMVRQNLDSGVQPNVPVEQLLADLAELEAGVKRCEKAVAQEYATAVNYIDSHNDLELISEDILERMELMAEYFDEHAMSEAAEWIRKVNNNEDPGPPPPPPSQTHVTNRDNDRKDKGVRANTNDLLGTEDMT